jgi:hypothetical protein
LTKATEKAVEKLANAGVRRPAFVHAAGSDFGETGGFKSLGDFAHTVMQKDRGDYQSLTRLQGWRTLNP